MKPSDAFEDMSPDDQLEIEEIDERFKELCEEWMNKFPGVHPDVFAATMFFHAISFSKAFCGWEPQVLCDVINDVLDSLKYTDSEEDEV